MADADWARAADDQERLSQAVKKIEIAAPASGEGEGAQNTKKTVIETDEKQEKQLTAAERSILRKQLHDTLVQNNQKLEIQQKDPNSPLYSVKSFAELKLREELIKGIYDMGFNHPSRIQETALPMLLANPPENMIAQSQSGTGKTAAFVLTMLSRINLDNKWPQCICLSPTYELALQTGRTVEIMGKCLKELSVAYAVRNNKVKRNTVIPSQIVIGTPGTMLDWCLKQRVVNMKKINVFVLDEADVMIDTQGFKDMSIKLHRELRKETQVLLFSATYDEQVMSFAKRVVSNANLIRLRRDEETLDNIKQYYVKCRDANHKYRSLTGLSAVLSVGQGIIFCHTRKTASWLANKMHSDKYVVALLSGDLDVMERASILKRFKNGQEKWLVTTNVCSRGIDVEQVTLVINFDLPTSYNGGADCETYLHRIGRTGRFGKSGVAVNFVVTDRDWDILKDIEKHFNKEVMVLEDTEDIDEMTEKLGEE